MEDLNLMDIIPQNYQSTILITILDGGKGHSKINEYPLTSNYISYPFNKINVFKRN